MLPDTAGRAGGYPVKAPDRPFLVAVIVRHSREKDTVRSRVGISGDLAGLASENTRLANLHELR